MASSIQLLRSLTARERPFAGNLLEGQPAINIEPSEPGLFFKATDGSIVKIGPASISDDGIPPNSSPAGSSGNSIGELWLDKSLDPPVLKVYDGVTWIDAGSGAGGSTATYLRWIYTAIGGETALSGSSGGVLLSFTPGLEEVYVNGVLLTRNIDYTAATGTSIDNVAALTAGDVVTVIALNPVDEVLNSQLDAASVSFTQVTSTVQRSVQAKFQEYVSVTDFIPANINTSTTDCTAFFNEAFNAGKDIYVPAGRYLIQGKLNVVARTRVHGVSYRNDTFGGSSLLLDGPAAFVEMATECIFEGFSIRGYNGAERGIVVPNGSRYCMIRDLTLRDFTIAGLDFETGAYSNRVMNVTAIVCTSGFRVTGSAEIDLFACSASGALSGGHNFNFKSAGVVMHGGSAQNPTGTATNVYAEDSNVCILGTYFEGGQVRNITCKAVTNPKASVYAYGIHNFSMGFRGCLADGGRIVIDGFTAYGDGSTGQKIFETTNGGIVQVGAIDAVTFDPASANFIEFVGAGIRENGHAIIATSGKKITTFTPSMLNAAVVGGAHYSSSVTGAVTYTRSDSWQLNVTASNNSPFVEINLLNADPDNRLVGLENNIFLLHIVGKWVASGTGFGAIRPTNNSVDIISFDAPATTGVVASDTWASLSCMGVITSTAPTNLNLRILLSQGPTGSALGDTVYIDRIDFYTLS